jgi:hypothetical protein
MNILFLCTGNSCRSQMAEGWARKLGGDFLEVQSAGIERHGQNPRAISVMREAGVDITTQESTRLTEDMLASADLVINRLVWKKNTGHWKTPRAQWVPRLKSSMFSGPVAMISGNVSLI